MLDNNNLKSNGGRPPTNGRVTMPTIMLKQKRSQH